MSKILVINDSWRVPGVQPVGNHGEAGIHLFVLALRHGITADRLADERYALPTFAANIKRMP